LSEPAGIAISGNNLYIANYESGTIGEYGLNGSPVNASLISGLHDPNGIAISGNNLFVAENQLFEAFENNGTIGEYTTSGTTVNATLIAGLTGLTSIAISPEPSAGALAGLGAAALISLRLARTLRPKHRF